MVVLVPAAVVVGSVLYVLRLGPVYIVSLFIVDVRSTCCEIRTIAMHVFQYFTYLGLPSHHPHDHGRNVWEVN